MATHVTIFFEKSDTTYDVPNVQKVRIPEDKRIFLRCSDGGSIVVDDLDFRNSRNDIGSRPDYSNGIYEYKVTDDDLYVKIAAKVSSGEALPEINPVHAVVTDFPTNVYLVDGLYAGDEIPTTTSPDWIPPADFTYPEKQSQAVEWIREWRRCKIEWLKNVNNYIDLNADLPKHIGYWLRSADRVIQKFFQDPDIDPLIVAEIARQACEGPSAYDPNNPAMLFRNLMSVINTYPNGPDFSAIWVETHGLTAPSDVQRKTILQVLQTRGTAADETYDLPTGYDSTQDDWIVENQPGIVTYDNDSPAAGESITATLTDYDGGIENVRYRWQEQSQDGTWSNMSGAANRMQTWTIGTAGTYRCRVLYNDNYATGQEAFGAAFTII